jgi:hypothetical protein
MQQESANQQIALFREQAANAERLLRPYVDNNTTAFRMMQAALGIRQPPRQPQMQQPGVPNIGGAGGGAIGAGPSRPPVDPRDISWQPYFDGLDGREIAIDDQGQDGGVPGGVPQTAPLPQEDEIDADFVWSAFNNSPWGRIARDSSASGQRQFMGMAGATGSALSGRTARGLADVANENTQAQFGNYFTGLGALVDIDMGARSGIASSGENSAQNISSALSNSAIAQANARLASGNAWAQGLGGVGQAIGWGLGQIRPPDVGSGNRITAHGSTAHGSGNRVTAQNPARFFVPNM